jgi:outer membrane protein assembly factor BamB
MQKSKLTPLFILILVIALAVPITVLASGHTYPDIISLPDGFRPEGIAVGKGHTFYTGSLANGAIYRGDLRTGEGGILVAGQEGRVAVGMNFDERSNNLFVAGGGNGEAYVYNGSTGEELVVYTLSPGFINDVIVTRQAAYFTNSFAGEFYRLPLGPQGALPDQADVQTIPLSGDWVQDSGFNANGIEASANGKDLIIVNTSRGELYKVDPRSGHAMLIDLGGADVLTGDGLVLRGASLFVVQNRLNQIAEIALAPDWGSGEVVELLTNPSFDVPTTAAAFGNALYAVNARFGTLPTPDTTYDAVRVPLN